MAHALIAAGWQSLLDCFAPLCCPLCGGRLTPARSCLSCRFPDPDRAMRQLRGDRLGEFLLLAGGSYGGDLRRIVHAFKYRGDPGALHLLAGQAARALLSGPAWDALVPVPGHPRRVRERGWEPTGDLAAELGRRCGLPVRCALARVRDTPPLTGKSAARRRRLVRGAFRAGAADGRLLVVDDVATTGATFRSCRSALIDAGALSVDLLVAAATPRRFF